MRYCVVMGYTELIYDNASKAKTTHIKKTVENYVGKGESVCRQYFLLFSTNIVKLYSKVS